MWTKHPYSLKRGSLLNHRKWLLSWVSIFLLCCCLIILTASRMSNRVYAQDAATPGGSGISISDVIGLTEELELRAPMGTNFIPGRVAVINAAGQIDGAGGNPGDCVHVDGSSGACDASTGSGTGPPQGNGSSSGSGSGVAGNNFSDSEVPQGSLDGDNRIFALSRTPNPPASLHVYYNGLRLTPGVDYGVSGIQFIWLRSSAPQPSDSLIADYRY